MPDQTDDNAQRIACALDRLSRVSREMQFVDGLNPAQWEALRYLASANKYSRTPGALAEYLGATKGTVSQTLIALESKGLIKRVRDTIDKRRVTLDVTEKGTAFICRDPLKSIAKAAAAMTTGSCADVANGLEWLLREIQFRKGNKKFGICSTCGMYVGDAAPPCAENQRCGLTGDPITRDDTTRLCVNHSDD